MMARMGTAVVAGMVAAFACEVGMKAILITRRDEAEKTHDLGKLNEALPEDVSRKRLEALVLRRNRRRPGMRTSSSRVIQMI